MPTRVTDMEFDENSFVDVPANQLGRILLTKAAGGTMPKHDDGEMVDIADLNPGDVIAGSDGEPIELTEEDIEALHGLEPEDFAEEPELEPVGKDLSFTDNVIQTLSKAFESNDRDVVVKAVAGEITELRKRAERAEEIAKAERERRLDQDYTARAAQYGLPGVDPADLGPVMKRAAQSLPQADCVLLNKVFEAAGEMAELAFEEIGKGAGSGVDPFGLTTSATGGQVDVSKADDVVEFFTNHPDAYDQMEAERRAAFGI